MADTQLIPTRAQCSQGDDPVRAARRPLAADDCDLVGFDLPRSPWWPVLGWSCERGLGEEDARRHDEDADEAGDAGGFTRKIHASSDDYGEYALTALGVDLGSALEPLDQWSRRWTKQRNAQ